MKPTFLHHLRSEWPLALVTVILLVYLVVVLSGGVFYTNQGNILRALDPQGYWRWVRMFIILFVAGLSVLIGSYLLAR